MDEGGTVLINAFAMICEAMLVSEAFGLSLRLTDLDAGHPKPLLPHQMVLAPLGSLGEGAAGGTVELVRDPGEFAQKGPLVLFDTHVCEHRKGDARSNSPSRSGKFCPSNSRTLDRESVPRDSSNSRCCTP